MCLEETLKAEMVRLREKAEASLHHWQRTREDSTRVDWFADFQICWLRGYLRALDDIMNREAMNGESQSQVMLLGTDPGGLLPCPFCGGAARCYTDGDGPMTGQAVRCVVCGARTSVDIGKPQEGVRRWQSRGGLDPLPSHMDCGHLRQFGTSGEIFPVHCLACENEQLRTKLKETKRYLRAANKGAERNALVAQLAVARNLRKAP